MYIYLHATQIIFVLLSPVFHIVAITIDSHIPVPAATYYSIACFSLFFSWFSAFCLP